MIRLFWSVAPFAAAGIVLTGMIWLAAGQPVDVVEVSGDLSAVEREMIQRAVAGPLATSLVGVSVAKVRDAIEALEWTDHVAVRRRWPGRIEIAVTKPVPVALWDERRLVTSRGEVIEAEHGSSLPRISTTLSGPERGLEMLQLAKQLTVRTGLEVVALTENAMGEWQFETASGIEVRLGSRATAERLRRFESVYRDELGPGAREIDYVDLRYANGLAVKWRDTEPPGDDGDVDADEAAGGLSARVGGAAYPRASDSVRALV